MAVNVGNEILNSSDLNKTVQSNYTYDNLVCKITNALNKEGLYNVIEAGNVYQLVLNGNIAFIWQDAKGNSCYSFDLLEKEYFTTSANKLGNTLTSHFGYTIEVVNNAFDSSKKVSNAITGLNKALFNSQMYQEHSAYLQDENQKYGFEKTGSFKNVEEYTGAHYYLAPQENQQKSMTNQEQLHQESVDLSTNQLEYSKQVYYIFINELPVVQKEEFKPYIKLAFYMHNGLIYKGSCVPTKYMLGHVYGYSINNSRILMFIFYMANSDVSKAMDILKWLVYSFNAPEKLPYILVLHANDDELMRLFYEEIVVPLLGQDYCEIIDNDHLDKKSLSTLLDKKRIYNFNNIITPTILNSSAKDFLKRLIYKEEYKLNSKIITTVANILVTSISKYIPLIAKDVPSVIVNVETCLDGFCRDNNISADYYAVTNFIKHDLDNFSKIIRSIDVERF